jgi:mRNA interferase HigB
MRIVGRSRLEAFCEEHTDARRWIEHWLAEVEEVTWATSQDIRSRYVSASFLSGNIVIFNVKGNHYRLEVTVAYESSVVIVKWAGTHAEYDQRNRKR